MLSLRCWLLDLCLRGDDYVGELPEDALEVEAELGLGLDPERPVDEFEKLGLKQIHLLEADAAHEGQEVVAVEHVVVELWGEQNCWEDKPIKKIWGSGYIKKYGSDNKNDSLYPGWGVLF